MKLTRGGCIITKSRFDLEDNINDCWGITGEIAMLNERLLDGYPGIPDLTPDQVANILIGLESLYDAKFQRLWDTFCQVCELDDYASDDGGGYDAWVDSVCSYAAEFERNMKGIKDEEDCNTGSSYSVNRSTR